MASCDLDNGLLEFLPKVVPLWIFVVSVVKIAWTTLRKRSKNMIFVNKIEVYNLKKRACGGLHSQRCSTYNVTHPQHHQSHHTSGAQEDSACTRTHRRRASTQLRLLKNVFKQLKTAHRKFRIPFSAAFCEYSSW